MNDLLHLADVDLYEDKDVFYWYRSDPQAAGLTNAPANAYIWGASTYKTFCGRLIPGVDIYSYLSFVEGDTLDVVCEECLFLRFAALAEASLKQNGGSHE